MQFIIRVANLECAGEDFLKAKGRCCAVLAALCTAGHLNMSLPGSGVENHSTRLLSLLDAVQPRLGQEEIVHLRARLQEAAGHSHQNAALELNPSPSVMAPLADYDSVNY